MCIFPSFTIEQGIGCNSFITWCNLWTMLNYIIDWLRCRVPAPASSALLCVLFTWSYLVDRSAHSHYFSIAYYKLDNSIDLIHLDPQRCMENTQLQVDWANPEDLSLSYVECLELSFPNSH